MTRPVTATYRLQLHAGFGFADAVAQVPYLARLGVSHLYLSPVLQAAPGSTHGYDVVDHSRVSDELGGMAGFERLAATAHEHDLGVVVDIVPNHMALSAPEHLNRPLWLVLREGRDARTASWFDIDWKAMGGRIGLPVLGTTPADAIERGDLHRDTLDGEPVLRYFDHVWPLALGTEHLTDLTELLQRQHYLLAHWRDKDEVLNYRRFFEVDELIALRVEDENVFGSTHGLLLSLHQSGVIDGFRIDHPDGLADPAGYLTRLRQACTRDAPIWVEKILERGERLPEDWDCWGTTGYDALSAVQAALIDPDSAPVLQRTWAECTEGGYDETVATAKRQVVTEALGPEVDRLTRRAREALPDLDPDRLRGAIIEILVAGDVYRAYVAPEQQVGAAAAERLRAAFATAVASRPDLHPELDALIPLAVIAGDDPATTDFGVRLQQTWGPVMAKGIEDTTFYRWHQLIAVNEVGSDPTVVDAASAEALHQWCDWHQEHWPGTMTTLSTHDTKRSEDVRARVLALAGDPRTWEEISRIAQTMARDHQVDPPTAHLVWQTLAGVGEIDDDRLTSYLQKALREAKTHTTWIDVDEAYERRVIDFAQHATRSGALHDAIQEGLERNTEAIRATVLAAKLLQLTMPGVPDVYQGCESTRYSLVDPDNRRPVPFDDLRRRLDHLDPTDLATEKLLVTTTALHLRREHADVFGPRSTYQPLADTGDHVLGFVRSSTPKGLTGLLGRGSGTEIATLATRAPGRLQREGGWKDTDVALPEGDWHDVLTGTQHTSVGALHCRDLFATHPVALLERTV